MATKKSPSGFILLLVIFLAIQCGSVKRISTSQVTDLSGRWNDTDARLVAEEMSQDVLNKPWLAKFIDKYGFPPVLIVGEFLNKSNDHIEPETFIKDIERVLINTQSVRIVNHGSFRESLRNERQEGQNKLSSTAVQKKLGHELGADFMLFGSINSMVDSKAAGKHRVIFYQINLELTDLATNEIVWIGDKKIKKYVKK